MFYGFLKGTKPVFLAAMPQSNGTIIAEAKSCVHRDLTDSALAASIPRGSVCASKLVHALHGPYVCTGHLHMYVPAHSSLLICNRWGDVLMKHTRLQSTAPEALDVNTQHAMIEATDAFRNENTTKGFCIRLARS